VLRFQPLHCSTTTAWCVDTAMTLSERAMIESLLLAPIDGPAN